MLQKNGERVKGIRVKNREGYSKLIGFLFLIKMKAIMFCYT